MTSLQRALHVAAVLCFALDVLGLPLRIPLVPLGLACWAASTL